MDLISRFQHAFKHYNTVYVAVDIHGTILKPTFNKTLSHEYYPFAKKVMQMLTKQRDTLLIMWSSSSESDLFAYDMQFCKDDIIFNWLNENPDCHNTEYADFSKKMYFDVGLDDRFGFNPYIDWFILYVYFKIKMFFE